MKILISILIVFVFACFFSSTDFFADYRVVEIVPYDYHMTVVAYEQEDKVPTGMVKGAGGGALSGAAVGFCLGGPFAVVAGAILGANGGAAAGGSVDSTNEEAVQKSVNLNGFIMTLDDGKTYITQTAYKKGQMISAWDLRYDKPFAQ